MLLHCLSAFAYGKISLLDVLRSFIFPKTLSTFAYKAVTYKKNHAHPQSHRCKQPWQLSFQHFCVNFIHRNTHWCVASSDYTDYLNSIWHVSNIFQNKSDGAKISGGFSLKLSKFSLSFLFSFSPKKVPILRLGNKTLLSPPLFCTKTPMQNPEIICGEAESPKLSNHLFFRNNNFLSSHS